MNDVSVINIITDDFKFIFFMRKSMRNADVLWKDIAIIKKRIAFFILLFIRW